MQISQHLQASDLEVGLEVHFSQNVTAEHVDQFSAISGDYNPLHNSESFAKELGFKTRVIHGAFQQGLISRVLGMYIPGTYSLIQRVTTAYSNPAFVGDCLEVFGKLIQWDLQKAKGQVEVTIKSSNAQTLSYTIVDFGLTKSEPLQSAVTQPVKRQKIAPEKTARSKSLLFVGGTSGLAREVKHILSTSEVAEYSVLTLGRRECDYVGDFAHFSDTDWGDILAEVQPYGVIHFASLPPVKSCSWDLDMSILTQNILVSLNPLKAVAKYKAESGMGLKRIIAISSAWARHLLPEKGFESYSYVKMLQSHYVKDLARDLAKTNVTVNSIAPSETVVGMNARLAPRTQALIAAKSPSGRLTSVVDIAQTIAFLLSEQCDQLTGQEIVLAGGRSA